MKITPKMVKKFRVKHELTQSQLGEIVDRGLRCVQKWEDETDYNMPEALWDLLHFKMKVKK
jgi:DNA-binding transcriptional regulator YiaG